MTAQTNLMSDRFERIESTLRQVATRSDLARMETRLTRWTVASMLAGMVMAAAIGVAARTLTT